MMSAILILMSIPSLMQANRHHLAVHQQMMNHLRDGYRRYMIENDAAIQPVQTPTIRSNTSGLGSIRGQITGMNPEDLSTVYVEAWSADSIVSEWQKGLAKIEPDFSYQIDNLLSGEYFVMLWAEGFRTQFYDEQNDLKMAGLVKVESGQVTSGIDFKAEKLQPGTGRISGQILYESDGTPTAKAMVQAFSSDFFGEYGYTFTDSTGFYSISELHSGEYWVEVFADGYQSELYDNSRSYEQATNVVVKEPDETGGINFQLKKSGSISGNVTDSRGNPLIWVKLEAQIRMDYSSGTTGWDSVWFNTGGTGYSDSTGNYQISGLEDGTYIVNAVYYDQWYPVFQWYNQSQSPADATPVLVSGTEETTQINFRMPLLNAAGQISGQVRDADNLSVMNASLQLESWDPASDGDRPSWFYASTDSDGYYQFDKIPEGRYRLNCSAQIGWNYVSFWWQNADQYEKATLILLGDSQVLRDYDFVLPVSAGNSSISGKAYSSLGDPLPNTYIQIYPIDSDPGKAYGTAYGTSDSLGCYRVNNLPAGHYKVLAAYYGYNLMGQQWYNQVEDITQATILEVGENQKLEGINFAIKVKAIYGAVTGKIINAASGVPISGAYIELNDAGNSSGFRYYSPTQSFCPPGIHYIMTDDAGEFFLDWIQEGHYTLVAYTDGGMSYYQNEMTPELATPVLVTGGETTTVKWSINVRNEGNSGIRGRVSESYNYPSDSIMFNPLYPAVVLAKSRLTIAQYPQSEMVYSAVVQKDGTYSLKGLSPGEYYVMGFSPYHIMEYYDHTIDPGQAEIINVAENQVIEGVDFGLFPIYYMNWKATNNPMEGYSPSIFGRVQNDLEDPISDAGIYLLNSEKNPVSFTRSSQGGEYSFYNTNPGEYYLQASRLGFSSVFNGNCSSPSVLLKLTDQPLEVNFSLTQPTSLGELQPVGINKPLSLMGNYPNPFNPDTRILFSLSQASAIQIRIFNSNGELVRLIDVVQLYAGFHQIRWDGFDQHGRPISSGVYLYQIESRQGIQSGKMTLLR